MDYTCFVYFRPIWLLGPGWGPSQGAGVCSAHAVFSLSSSKIEIPKNAFFNIVATHNDQVSHAKHGIALYDLLRHWIVKNKCATWLLASAVQPPLGTPQGW